MYDKITDINDPTSGTPWLSLNGNGLEYRVTKHGWQSRPAKEMPNKTIIALGTFWTVMVLLLILILVLNS